MKCPVKASLIIISILILLQGCSNISQNEAELAAKNFINDRVGFFTKKENTTVNLPQYDIDSITSFQKDGNWNVIMHISATVDGVTKKNDLAFIVSKKGEVIEFNGQKVLN